MPCRSRANVLPAGSEECDSPWGVVAWALLTFIDFLVFLAQGGCDANHARFGLHAWTHDREPNVEVESLSRGDNEQVPTACGGPSAGHPNRREWRADSGWRRPARSTPRCRRRCPSRRVLPAGGAVRPSSGSRGRPVRGSVRRDRWPCSNVRSSSPDSRSNLGVDWRAESTLAVCATLRWRPIARSPPPPVRRRRGLSGSEPSGSYRQRCRRVNPLSVLCHKPRARGSCPSAPFVVHGTDIDRRLNRRLNRLHLALPAARTRNQH